MTNCFVCHARHAILPARFYFIWTSAAYTGRRERGLLWCLFVARQDRHGTMPDADIAYRERISFPKLGIDELRGLLRSSLSLYWKSNLQETCEGVLSILNNCLQFQYLMLAIAETNDSGEWIVGKACQGANRELVTDTRRVRYLQPPADGKEDILSYVWRTQKLVVVDPRDERDENSRKLHRPTSEKHHHVQPIVFIPLVGMGGTVGVIHAIANWVVKPLPDDFLDLVYVFATSAAFVVEHTLLDTQNQTLIQCQDTLFKISGRFATAKHPDDCIMPFLTGVTAAVGLGFNRVVLFLIDDATQPRSLVGKEVISPQSTKHWREIDAALRKWEIDDYFQKHEPGTLDQGLAQVVKAIRAPIEGEYEVFAAIRHAGARRIRYATESAASFGPPSLTPTDDLWYEDMVMCPLRVKDRAIGLVIADNQFSGEPIRDWQIGLLRAFCDRVASAMVTVRLQVELAESRTAADKIVDVLTKLITQASSTEAIKCVLSSLATHTAALHACLLQLSPAGRVVNAVCDVAQHSSGLSGANRVSTSVAARLDDKSFYTQIISKQFPASLMDRQFAEAPLRVPTGTEAAEDERIIAFRVGRRNPPEGVLVLVGEAARRWGDTDIRIGTTVAGALGASLSLLSELQQAKEDTSVLSIGVQDNTKNLEGAVLRRVIHQVRHLLGQVQLASSEMLQWARTSRRASASKLRVLETICAQASNVEDAISAFLKILSKGKRELTSLDVNDDIARVLRIFKYLLDRAGVEVEKDLADDLPCVLGNSLDLLEVLYNLVDNALRALDRSATKKLTLKTQFDSKWVQVLISDTGTGISPTFAL